MDNKFKVISYNCHSLNSNSTIIANLLKECDILCLQETLIDKNNFQNLEQFDKNFSYAYEPSYRNISSFTGRSAGGLVIFWKGADKVNFTPLYYDKRVMGLKVSFEGGYSILILNVYCICDYGNVDCFIEYKSTLATMDNIAKSENYNELFIVGDFNADPSKGRFFNQLKSFCEGNSLFASDIDNLPENSYSYVSSNATCSTSWLDHVLSSNLAITANHKILYGFTVYDHIPICFDLILPAQLCLQFFDYKPPSSINNNVNWDKVTVFDRQNYCTILDSLILEISPDVFICRKDVCHDVNHINDLNDIYNDILECISLATSYLPTKKTFNKNDRVVGWNTYCKEKYAIAREKYLIWHNNGRVRQGIEFESMKMSRTSFKNALNYCKNNELKIKKENLLRKFACQNKINFWKDISKLNGNSGQKIVQIDSLTNLDEITAKFDEKYKRILDDPSCQSFHTKLTRPDSGNVCVPLITIENLNLAVHSLNFGLGWDNVHANNIKYAGPVFMNFLGKYFNKLIDHSFLPKEMIYGEIRPVIKSKVSSKNDSDNYRPVMNSSVFLKVLEYCLLPSLKKNLPLNKRQFGFRSGTGCLPAIALVKEIINKYNIENSSVYCAMVDLSKAFDRINKNILFKKLYEAGLNPKFVEILRCMYDEAYVHTSFNKIKGKSWKVGNGVRQGGVLSPLLFSFYLNDILDLISELPLGCSIYGFKSNIVCFADDLILLAPTSQSLQKLLDVLCDRLLELCLTVNPTKSQFIIFRNSRCNNRLGSDPVVSLNGVNLTRVSNCKYLGVFLTANGDLGSEVDRVTDSFLKQFNGMYSKFYFTNKNIIFFLFKSFTSSFYGIETWIEKIYEYQLNRISIAYHKAVKRICDLNVWDSNHAACDTAGVMIFRHLWARRLVCFWHRMWHNISPCLVDLKYYFRYKSFLFARVYALFNDKYDVNISTNPLCAIISRIIYVQIHEERSFYVPD